MPATQIAPGLYELSLGMLNVHLLESEDGLVLFDTGYPNMCDKILAGIAELGYSPSDLRHIVITHSHPDHIGSLAALQKVTNAQTYVHPADAEIARTGTGFRKMQPAPGLISYLMWRFFMQNPPVLEPARVDHTIDEGDVLPFTSDMQVLHVPGHSAGQLIFLWPRHKVLILSDTVTTLFGLNLNIGYENLAQGIEQLGRICSLDFEIAAFGHGKPILKNAAQRFRQRWPSAVPASSA